MGEVALDHATPRWSGGVLAIKTVLMRAPAVQPGKSEGTRVWKPLRKTDSHGNFSLHSSPPPKPIANLDPYPNAVHDSLRLVSMYSMLFESDRSRARMDYFRSDIGKKLAEVSF